MNNKLGEFLKELRGFNSLRTVSAKTNSKISYTYLNTLEKGINPNNNQPVKPTPETLKILSEVYSCSYNKLLKLAGYLEEDDEENNVIKVVNEYKKLSVEDQQEFLRLIKIK